MKKKVIYFIIFVLVLIIIISMILGNKSKKSKTIDNDYKADVYVLNEKSKYSNNDDELDKNLYKEYIINEIVTSLEFSYLHEKKSVDGKLYLDNNKNLHITDTNDNLDIKVSDEKYKTMFAKEYEYIEGIFIFLLTESGKVHMARLSSNNIKDLYIRDLYVPFVVTNFTNLEFETDIYPSSIGYLVLAENGNIYDLFSGLRYSQKILTYDNLLYILPDNTLVNSEGDILKSSNKTYKIKNAIINQDADTNEIFIITEDDELLVFSMDYYKYLTVYHQKVKNIKIDKKPNIQFESMNVSIILDNNSSIDFVGACSKYFCPVEFSK